MGEKFVPYIPSQEIIPTKNGRFIIGEFKKGKEEEGFRATIDNLRSAGVTVEQSGYFRVENTTATAAQIKAAMDKAGVELVGVKSERPEPTKPPIMPATEVTQSWATIPPVQPKNLDYGKPEPTRAPTLPPTELKAPVKPSPGQML